MREYRIYWEDEQTNGIATYSGNDTSDAIKQFNDQFSKKRRIAKIEHIAKNVREKIINFIQSYPKPDLHDMLVYYGLSEIMSFYLLPKYLILDIKSNTDRYSDSDIKKFSREIRKLAKFRHEFGKTFQK